MSHMIDPGFVSAASVLSDGYTLAIGNALPASILADLCSRNLGLQLIPLTPEQARMWIEGASQWGSCVGHQETAAILSGMIGITIPFNRESLPANWIVPAANWHDQGMRGSRWLITALYQGPRLPEGACTLPEGASLQLFLVSPLHVWGGDWVSAAQTLALAY